ncbi:hypothetical protein MSG28_009995 [Choristoneura fumiferana]|uniref:Uncharacterized protein n=1 Tax=Choristoneura fumiferana TaxID=7141 RepID=A0ACC0KIQ5_CHOFU|nr:hypothetical protein MSG28_009995 [Choristoneura fumiferana]
MIGMRHVMVLLLFLSTTVAYATRVSMSVAIVAMTSKNDYGYPVFDWDRSIQDTILSPSSGDTSSCRSQLVCWRASSVGSHLYCVPCWPMES